MDALTLIELELFSVMTSLLVVELLQPTGTVKLDGLLIKAERRFLLLILPLNCESSTLDRESVSDTVEAISDSMWADGLELRPAMAPRTEQVSVLFGLSELPLKMDVLADVKLFITAVV